MDLLLVRHIFYFIRMSIGLAKGEFWDKERLLEPHFLFGNLNDNNRYFRDRIP